MLAVLTGYLAMLSGPVAAQAIVVNGVSCPTATVRLTQAGLVAVLPSTCSGNGNACSSAIVTYSSTGISIQAPAACATAPDGAPMVLQTVNVNGSLCNGATVTLSASGVSINAPTMCLNAPTLPVISGFNSATAIAGQTVVISGSNFASNATVTVGSVPASVLGSTGTTSLSIAIPFIANGMQPVVVTVGAQSSVAVPIEIVSVSGAVELMAVQSRKTHGAAGVFNIPIDTAPLIGGLVTVEPRNTGAGHVIVFQFNGMVTSAGTVAAIDSTGAAVGASALASANEVAVSLTGTLDSKRVTVTLTGVNSTTNAAASIGFLPADVNNSRTVTSSDISATKSRSGQVASATNFRSDVNTSGSITSSDISNVKARSGTALP